MLVDYGQRLIALKNNIIPYLEEKKIIKKRDDGLKEEIEKAHHQWQQARHYFNNVSEPELVDHASYLIQAARIKYMYLLNKAKNNWE